MKFDFAGDSRVAAALGLPSAIILNKLELFESSGLGREFSGVRYVFETYEGWAKIFPFWSEKTIERKLTSLEALGIIHSIQPDGYSSRKKYYRIDHDKMSSSVANHQKGQNVVMEDVKMSSSQDVKMSSSLTKSLLESEDNLKIGDDPEEILAAKDAQSNAATQPIQNQSVSTPDSMNPFYQIQRNAFGQCFCEDPETQSKIEALRAQGRNEAWIELASMPSDGEW